MQRISKKVYTDGAAELFVIKMKTLVMVKET